MPSTYSWSYAPTNRATCKGACKEKIDKGAVRLGVAGDGPGDYTMSSYRCLSCVTDKQIANIESQMGALSDVEGFALLSAKDQKAVMKQCGSAKAKATGKAKAAAAKAPGPKAKAAAAKAPGPKAKAPGPKAKAVAKSSAAKHAAKAQSRPTGKAKAKDGPSEADQHAFLDKAKEFDLEAVKALVEAEPSLVNVSPAGRWSALHQFASQGNPGAVEWLLKHGANKNLKSKDGETPIDVATGKSKKFLESWEDDNQDEAEEAEEEELEEEPEEKDEEENEAEVPQKAGVKRKAEPAGSSGSPAKKAKAGRSVDGSVPDRAAYNVVDDWSVVLNQTNVGANNNKYYKIQLLSGKAGKFYCWTHWGRVGAPGQFKMDPCSSREHAEREFKAKFKQKSGVPYDNVATHDWTPTIGKYTFVETDEQDGADGGATAPLGKLSPQQIEKGQDVLHRINNALPKKNKETLALLSGEFYTLIPHDFGFKAPPPINSPDMLEAEEELLKFYLRMGFEEMDKADDGLSPINGVMELDLPKSLGDAAGKLCKGPDIKTSNDKGKKHQEKQSGNPTQEMEAHLYAAIMLYTSNAIYRDLNNVLRSEDRTKIKKYFAYLRLLMEALERLPKKTKDVWRGVGVDLFDEYRKGATVTWWGVSSCTADVSVAKNFMNGCGGKCTLLTIKSKTARDISDITFFGNEKENLLAPGTQLKVLNSKRKGSTTEISMEEVGRVLG